MLHGCGSSEVPEGFSVEERFEMAKRLFDKGDYLEAINQFTVITLQYQGSAYAGDAQYYLAESRFMREEFLLAAFEYQTLKRNMSASPRVPDAQYKLGLSYYQLAPKSRLDQQYSKRAIEDLQTFVEYYPGHPQVPDAEAKINELTSRLAKKEFDAAELYATMDYYRAALLTYDVVIEKYHDTEYAPLAYLGKVEVYISRDKYHDAKFELDKFYENYPNSVVRTRADKLRESVEKYLKDVSPESDRSNSAQLGVRQ